MDGEFEDYQFSGDDVNCNVADTTTTSVVEEFGISIAQLYEVECVDSEDLRSISKF